MIHTVVFVVVAFVAGTVSPSLGRKLKAFVAKEEAAAKSAVAKIDAKFDTELKKL